MTPPPLGNGHEHEGNPEPDGSRPEAVGGDAHDNGHAHEGRLGERRPEGGAESVRPMTRRGAVGSALDVDALTDFLLDRPEAAGEGTRFLARDLPVRDGVHVDLLGIDRTGRWVLVLCGEAEGSLLLRAVDAARAFRHTRSLVERLLAESPRRATESPRVFLVVHRATPEFLEQMSFLTGLETDVYEFRTLGRGRSGVNFCRVSLAAHARPRSVRSAETASAPVSAPEPRSTPAGPTEVPEVETEPPRMSTHPPHAATSTTSSAQERADGDVLSVLRASLGRVGPEVRGSLDEDRLEVFLEEDSFVTIVRDGGRYFLRPADGAREEEISLDEPGRARLLDRVLDEYLRRTMPPPGGVGGDRDEEVARLQPAMLTAEELQALRDPVRKETPRSRPPGKRPGGRSGASRKEEGRDVENEPSGIRASGR